MLTFRHNVRQLGAFFVPRVSSKIGLKVSGYDVDQISFRRLGDVSLVKVKSSPVTYIGCISPKHSTSI